MSTSQSAEGLSDAKHSGSHPTIAIHVNAQQVDVAAGASVLELLAQLGLQRRGLAVEVNGEIVPRQAWGERLLQADDRVEVVSLVGGG